MPVLIPTPVTLEDLIDNTSLINAFNDGVVAQADSPRFTGTDFVTVEVTDDPYVNGSAYWTQRSGGGEWVRNDRLNDTIVNYALPVDLSNVDLHMVVYPWLLADLVNYPAK